MDIGTIFWGVVGLIALVSLRVAFTGSTNHSSSYDKTSPGLSGMFGVVVALLFIGLVVLWTWND